MRDSSKNTHRASLISSASRKRMPSALFSACRPHLAYCCFSKYSGYASAGLFGFAVEDDDVPVAGADSDSARTNRKSSPWAGLSKAGSVDEAGAEASGFCGRAGTRKSTWAILK